MKPHEQEWSREETPYGKGTRVVVRDERGRTVAEFPAFDPTARDVRWHNAELAQAAPEMARALLSQGYESNGAWHTAVCWEYTGGEETKCWEACRDVKSALHKAGVLP